ncbi:MAG: efflux RND transporter permease subunit [Acidobacteriaceae bacterium]|nr:efflux RND transporter permease subunit [Acidobacteriaceae bacterium]
MWIVRLALRRPYTFVVLSLLLLLIAPVALLRTPVDIFPAINIPVVSVVWTYTGLVPTEIANRIVSIFERSLTTSVNNIEHIESQSLNGVAVVKVFLQPNANVDSAISEIIAESQVGIKQFPPGTTPPLVLSYNAATVPILQLGLSGKGLSEQQLNDLGNNQIRPQLATVPGASLPIPYGGKVRQIMVDIDSNRLLAHGLSPMDVVNAVNAQNVILPTGTAKIGRTEYNVELNSTPEAISALNRLPIKTVNGGTVFMQDVANIRDGYAVQTNIVRQDGQRGVLMTVQKTGNVSTLSIVSSVRAMLPKIAATLPQQLVIRPLFDQSIFVKASLQGVLREASIAAVLTALMILLFLGSWRSTLIIATSIPLSILTSLLILSALGETINIMTLGGLALAVGILVDDATVEIENVERHIASGQPLEESILAGAQEIAVPAFVSTISICIVFVPMFFLTGVAHYLFVPFAESVVFALLASYFFSRTLVPTMVKYLLPGEIAKHRPDGEKRRRSMLERVHHRVERGFEWLRDVYERQLAACLAHRKVFGICFVVFCAASVGLLVTRLGQDFFPTVDSGQFRLHLRASTGTRIENTARLTDEVEKVIRQTIPQQELLGILDNIGLPTSGINLSYSNGGTIGELDAEILVSLQARHHPTVKYVDALRKELPQLFPGTTFYFQPADIVTQILNFGLPSAIDVQIVGNDMRSNFALASKLASQIRAVPGSVDTYVYQLMNEPRFVYAVDRNKSNQMNLNQRDIATNLLTSLSSSFQTAPNFWVDPKNGVSYPIAIQTPQYKMDSLDSLGTIPVSNSYGQAQPIELLENVATASRSAEPAVVSHYNVRPVIDVYSSVEGRDLGSVARDVNKLTASLKLPRGTALVTRGQVATMRSSFIGLFAGLAFAIALVYLLIVVNFQSWLDALIIITALPGALAGICWCLFLTQTTLSVPALMGAIMSIGVATSNSVLVITFANERLAETRDAFQAALQAGATRLRPVIMTATAMMIGMIPMALGLGEGGEQNAPLGRAVIGGLLFATVATLFFVPVVFSLVHSRKRSVE